MIRLPSTFERVASLRALQHRSYLVLWMGAFVSNTGTWMQTIALGVFVTETTGLAGWTGTVAALTYFPAMVFGPLGGAAADRVDRRRYLLAGAVVQTSLAALLAGLAWSNRLTVPTVGAVVLVAGCVSAMVAPAFNALLSDLVPPEHLLSAVSLNSAQYNLGRILGPLLAAAAIAWGGVGAALAANAVSFLGSLLSVALLRLPPPVPALPEPIWAGVRRGLLAAHEDLGTRTALGLTLLLGILVAPFIGLVPVMAITLLGGGAVEASLLVASQGLGAVCAALVGGSIAERIGRRRLLVGAALAAACGAFAFWLAPSLRVASVTIFFLGGAYLTTLAGLSTVIQARTHRGLRARVSSLYGMLLGGGYALGLIVIGWMGDRFGIRLVGASAAGLCLLLLSGVRLLRPRVLSALEAPGAVPALAAPSPRP